MNMAGAPTNCEQHVNQLIRKCNMEDPPWLSRLPQWHLSWPNSSFPHLFPTSKAINWIPHPLHQLGRTHQPVFQLVNCQSQLQSLHRHHHVQPLLMFCIERPSNQPIASRHQETSISLVIGPF